MDNVYLIYGDEEFLIDKEIKNIINKFNSSMENVARYNLDESNVREAIEDACTISMFETNKIVICEKCNFLTGENKKEVNHDIDSLIKYINNPFSDSVLIFVVRNPKLDERKKVVKELKKCSKVIEDMINAWGGKAILYRTGASYTEFKTHEDNLPFGGEYSGHLYFRDRDADCASAIYASLRLLEILSKTSEKLSKMIKDFPKYYSTPEVKIPSDDNIKFNVVEQIKMYAKMKNYPINDIDGVRITYTNGWVLVRASNTGPNLTFRAEATSEQGIISLQNIYLPMIEEYNKPVDML